MNLTTSTHGQQELFPASNDMLKSDRAASTFVPNMKLPVHRWFRFSAGFSAEWVERTICKLSDPSQTTIFDPFAGSGTTLIAAERMGAKSYGVESHPFVCRIGSAKLHYRSDPNVYRAFAKGVRSRAAKLSPYTADYPPLIMKCFTPDALSGLDGLRRAWEELHDESPESELVWLTLLSILRPVSHVGTAPWQYVLPGKRKRNPADPGVAFDSCVEMFASDMARGTQIHGPKATLLQSDARTCEGIPRDSVDLVITSPPYPNNFDYADATRLEMTFMREIDGWGDLQQAVRQHLVRSCSQHVSERGQSLDEVLSSEVLAPIRDEITQVCEELGRVRQTKGGRKSYHLMVACYFQDMGEVWRALRTRCRPGAKVCFVIGDSAPYAVYVPVIEWMGKLAIAAGFKSFSFEKTRDRNIKWKNRKHRVPLCEGRLWVEG